MPALFAFHVLMLRVAANLSFFYQDMPFEARLAAAAEDGFKGVEYLSPYDMVPHRLAGLLQAHGLEQVLFNAPAGGSHLAQVRRAWDEGWRGTASLPGEQEAFRYGIDLALEYAQALSCRRVHVMSGINPSANRGDRLLWLKQLAWAAERAARCPDVTLLIEAINREDMPGYWLHTQQQAYEALVEVGHPRLAMQFDAYHCQKVEGDVLAQWQKYAATGWVKHVQIAGVPGRHEPDVGVLPYGPLLAQMQASDYDGWLGLEYRPQDASRAGVREGLRRWLAQGAVL